MAFISKGGICHSRLLICVLFRVRKSQYLTTFFSLFSGKTKLHVYPTICTNATVENILDRFIEKMDVLRRSCWRYSQFGIKRVQFRLSCSSDKMYA